MDVCQEMVDEVPESDNIYKMVSDIETNAPFKNHFDKIISRMCFHHLTNDTNQAFKNCKSMLMDGGSLIITESIPPTPDKDVVNWWTEMFALKEDRLVFTLADLYKFFVVHGFSNIQIKEIVTKKFSVNNWVCNQGLSEERQKQIKDMHRNAPQYVKEVQNIEELNGHITLDSKSIIIKGVKG
jgi:SAM-dependent methyltransferase